MKTLNALGFRSGEFRQYHSDKTASGIGIEVEEISFVTPFCLCRKCGCGATETAKTLSISLKTMGVGVPSQSDVNDL